MAFCGCQKETECDDRGSCIEVKGRLGSELHSTVPVGGAIIELSSLGNGSFPFSGGEIFIQRVTSDADGFYAIQFRPTAEMQQRGSYRLFCFQEGYGRESTPQGFYENLRLTPGNSYEENFHLPLLGGRLRILTTGFPSASATNNTYLTVESGRGQKGYLGSGFSSLFYGTNTTQVVGSSNTTDVTCSTAANEYAQVWIYKTKAGVHTTIRDSIYCPLNSPVIYTHTF